MKKRLTDRVVGSLKPPKKGNAIIWDTNKEAPAGFGVRITAAGTVSFVIDYRNAYGESRRFTIGQSSEWTVDQARTEASDFRKKIKNGADPVQAKRDGREEKRTEPTVKDLCKAYMERHVLKVNGPDQKKNARRMIDKVIVPRLGQRKLDALTTAEIVDLHVSMSEHKYGANQVLTVLKAALNKGIEWGMCTNNPARGIERHPEDERTNWLSETQLANLDAAITQYGKDSGELIRLLLLSGARRGEWMRAKKSDFDMLHGFWTKPAHAVKERRQEIVPLNAATMAVLRRVMASTPPSEPYLFAGTVAGRPRATVRRPWVQILRLAGLVEESTVAGKRGPLKRWKPTIRLHDLRHSYCSWLAEHGVPLLKIGKLVGHQRTETTERYAHIADKSLLHASDMFGNAMTKMVQ